MKNRLIPYSQSLKISKKKGPIILLFKNKSRPIKSTPSPSIIIIDPKPILLLHLLVQYLHWLLLLMGCSGSAIIELILHFLFREKLVSGREPAQHFQVVAVDAPGCQLLGGVIQDEVLVDFEVGGELDVAAQRAFFVAEDGVGTFLECGFGAVIFLVVRFEGLGRREFLVADLARSRWTLRYLNNGFRIRLRLAPPAPIRRDARLIQLHQLRHPHMRLRYLNLKSLRQLLIIIRQLQRHAPSTKIRYHLRRTHHPLQSLPPSAPHSPKRPRASSP